MIELVEVSPRDGLQNEAALLSTADKIALIGMAIDAGIRRIEVASFVNPRRVPQMADAEAVVAGLTRRTGVTTIGLVLNARGAERALATSVDEIGLVAVASDAFGIANQGMSSADSIAMVQNVAPRLLAAGRPVQATIAVAFGCPFSGTVPCGEVVAMARAIAAAGVREVALADTIGIARPAEVRALVAEVAAAIHPLPVRAHFHDTRGMGVANALAAVEAGAVTVDGAIGGTGGCPFAPGATGNVASEDLVFALGDLLAIDLEALVRTGYWLNDRLDRAERSALMRAMGEKSA